ncbi:hypothetical protein [Subtercola frigoramans]|uniref:Uncharacterized protein n=1 Tax=Subtercola frigoramans TaxID=120298 RepID=A0ABS2L1R2_9MICO|nr:hypothetical protein [Subtercola frigoramans]MBM7471007.1 hypothetical protein [Subtercola frigoramans]
MHERSHPAVPDIVDVDRFGNLEPAAVVGTPRSNSIDDPSPQYNALES